MCSRLRVVAAVLALALPLPARALADPVRILLYHRVGDPRYPSTNVSLDAFRAQMEWLRDEGFTVVSTRDLEAHLLGGKRLPAKPVVIQFDDGYRSVYENALPVLRDMGYPFCVFLPTRALDRSYRDYMTWDEVGRLAASGVEFGVHGHRHLRLGLPAPGQTPEEYERALWAELSRARDRFAARGLDPGWVAYPYGEYNPTVLRVCRDLGFRLGFSQDPGAVPGNVDVLRIPRFAVVGSMADQAVFRERMGYLALGLEEMDPEPGILASPRVPRFGARVLDPGRYEPGSLNLFVSERGRLADARFDPATGRVQAPGAALSRRLNRVLISLRDRESGRYALGSWLLLLPVEP